MRKQRHIHHHKHHQIERKSIFFLSDALTGEEVVILNVLGSGAFRKRITEMGFVKGKRVKVIKNAPLQDPVEYEIMGYNISLRRSEASMIQVVPFTGEESEFLPYEGID